MRLGVAVACAVLLSWAPLASGAAVAADCDVTVKETDGLKDLSAKLKCLHDRIKALEGKGAAEATNTLARPALPQPGNLERTKVFQNGSLQVELQKCGWSKNNNNLTCSFQLGNLTQQDKKACFGPASRLVTDSGSTFSSEQGSYNVGIASVEGYQGKWDKSPVCDVVPPLSKVKAWINFRGSEGQATAQVQFLRLDCGAGCVYEAYNIPIE